MTLTAIFSLRPSRAALIAGLGGLFLLGCAATGPLPIAPAPQDESADARIARLSEAIFCPCSGHQDHALNACPQGRDTCFEAQLAADTLSFSVRAGASDKAALDAVVSELEGLDTPHTFALEGRPRLGSPQALVEVVVFEDFECPACRRVSGRLPGVLAPFGERVSLVFKHFPLPQHPQASLAAQAAIAAHAQGAFWPFHDLLFEHQRELSLEKVLELATSLELDLERFQQDMRSPATEAVLAEDIADGVRAKLPGTPTIFVNGVDAGDVMSSERLSRRIELEIERQAIAGRIDRTRDRYVAQAAGAPASGADKTANRYPALAEFLPLLTDSERDRVFRLAESEICPCSDKIASLDSCLQKENGECVLAVRLAKVAMRAIKEGDSDAAIVDLLVQEVQTARTVHAFDLAKSPHKGADPAKAKLTIVEFADFGCHHCSEANKVVSKIAKDYPDEVTVYFKQFPLNPQSASAVAALAALAAHQQGKFWPMHDLLFANQPNIGPEHIVIYAQQLGIDIEAFSKLISEPSIAQQLQTDRTEGENAKIRGTPAFFIDGVRFMGDFEELEQAVKDRLGH